MKILFKYPTRDRVSWFKETLAKYHDMISSECNFQFLITADRDDTTMNNPEMLDYLAAMEDLVIAYGDSKTKIEACNADIGLIKDWDILVLVSDDMIPIVQDFDKIIVELMEKYFPDTDGALHFNDGLYGQDKCITFSVLGRKLYDRFGYVYHPSYRSFYCDNEFTDVVRALDKYHYDPRIIVKHEWHGGPNSTDALYRRNSGMKGDSRVYYRRRLLNFPIETSWRL